MYEIIWSTVSDTKIITIPLIPLLWPLLLLIADHLQKAYYVSSTLQKFIYFSPQSCEIDAIITLIFVLRETKAQRDWEVIGSIGV